ncbi:MAG: CPBP family intramembrane metalloprotease [Acidobacteria bacterium]|nr:CPBP family intramembrane metalloprotease [Acidobacteriota bacterium]
MVSAASQRLWKSLVVWPGTKAWTECGFLAAAVLLAMIGIGFSTGLYRLEPGNLANLPMLALGVFFVPALGEEAIFRGLLVPARTTDARPWKAIGWSTLAYVLWHPLEGLTFLPGAKLLFTRTDFLVVTGLLGLVCALMRWRTGSLWPAVFLHCGLVVIWKTWLGGPALDSLS